MPLQPNTFSRRRAFPLHRPCQATVYFEQWPLIQDGLRRAWCPLDLYVTVEHDGDGTSFDITDIEFAPEYEGCERHGVPETLYRQIETQIRGRDADRQRILTAIQEDVVYVDADLEHRLSASQLGVGRAA